MNQSVFAIIGDALICCCSDAAHIEIPEGVTKIGECAFSGCENLQNVTFPQSLTEIGQFAFLNCDQLQNLILPANVKRIGKAAFKGCKGLVDENGLVVVNHMVHDYCGESERVIIPEGITTIGYEAFYRNQRIRFVTLPPDVEFISSCAFDGCHNLTLQVHSGSRGEAFARKKGIAFSVIE